jgi:serine/threonine-protein kinase OSR1/STK39
MRSHHPDGLPEIAVAIILKEILKGLEYMHDNHMIHNDIRADNVFIDSRGEVRLGGFRHVSSLRQGGELAKSTFSLIGDNIEWAAPEVLTQVLLVL